MQPPGGEVDLSTSSNDEGKNERNYISTHLYVFKAWREKP
jgi:hypothetical protein